LQPDKLEEEEGDQIPLVEYNTANWDAIEAEVSSILKREIKATYVSVRDAGPQSSAQSRIPPPQSFCF